MMKILITGSNSYIGTNLVTWLNNSKKSYQIDTIDVQSNSWKNLSFSDYDTVVHVAGIAHVSYKKKMKDLYMRVNRDLPISIAKKAAEDGVKQFIFMSSMIVYNSNNKVIDKNTIPFPNNFYGLSKLEAERGLNELTSESFKVAIIRSPMVYGPNSKGNFQKMLNLSSRIKIFPNIKNKRSIIYIFNLTNNIKHIIDNQLDGIYFPQNTEYVTTSQLLFELAKLQNHKILSTRLFNFLIFFTMRFFNSIRKIFGTRVYDRSITNELYNYNVFSLNESLIECLKK